MMMRRTTWATRATQPQRSRIARTSPVRTFSSIADPCRSSNACTWKVECQITRQRSTDNPHSLRLDQLIGDFDRLLELSEVDHAADTIHDDSRGNCADPKRSERDPETL